MSHSENEVTIKFIIIQNEKQSIKTFSANNNFFSFKGC